MSRWIVCAFYQYERISLLCISNERNKGENEICDNWWGHHAWAVRNVVQNHSQVFATCIQYHSRTQMLKRIVKEKQRMRKGGIEECKVWRKSHASIVWINNSQGCIGTVPCSATIHYNSQEQYVEKEKKGKRYNKNWKKKCNAKYSR